MVPAVTINPSLNLVRAKSLASASVSNVLVKRGCRRLDSVPSVGTSKVTYQVRFMLRRRLLVACTTRENDKKPPPGRSGDGFFLVRDPPKFLVRDLPKLLYRRTPTRLTPPFALPPAL